MEQLVGRWRPRNLWDLAVAHDAGHIRAALDHAWADEHHGRETTVARTTATRLVAAQWPALDFLAAEALVHRALVRLTRARSLWEHGGMCEEMGT